MDGTAVQQVKYHKSQGGKLFAPEGTWIQFIIPKGSFTNIHATIQQRAGNRVRYNAELRTTDGRQMLPSIENIEKFDGTVEGTLFL